MSADIQQQKDLFEDLDSITIDLGNVSSSTMASNQMTGVVGNFGTGTYTITDSTSPYNYNYNWNTITNGGATDTILVSNIGGLTWDTTQQGNTGSLQVNGDANFEGDVKIKGKSLVESLEKIEEKLAVLHPNEKLEEKWEQLRELRKQYMELEKEIIEKEKVWDILKK